jgi:hypothetical protein
LHDDIREYKYKKPDIAWLAERYEYTENNLSDYRQKMSRNANIRFCRWTNQTEDGRKSGDAAYPWEGASDLRWPLVDDIINANVATLVEAERRGGLIGVPVEGSDISRAKLVGNLMKWLKNSQMEEMPREVELGANYWEEKGGFIAGIFWKKHVLAWQERVEIIDLARMLVNQGIDPESLMDPLFDEQFEALLKESYPDASDRQISEAIEELRSEGFAVLPKAGRTVNRPCVRVFRKGEDIIYPDHAADIQDAPYVFRVEYKNPQDVLEYVITDQWDEGWANKVVETCRGIDNNAYTEDLAERNRDRFGVNFDREDDDNLIKIVWAYQRLIDKDGVPGIYETIFCPEYTPIDKKAYAKHGLMEYRLRGRYPFWDFSRERISRLSYNSRGVPDMTEGFQKITKTYYDGEIDRQSQSIDPPFWYMIGRQVPERGPGAMWPVSRPGEAGYAEIPKYDASTFEMREGLINIARNYNGLITDEEHANEVRKKKQANINKWLEGWQQVYRMVFWLYQQYGDERITFRVMGSTTVSPEEFHKSSQEDFDFYLSYDALSDEPELQRDKLKAVVELFSAADRNGRGDWDNVLIKGVEIIDPTWAEMLIKPAEQASQDEVKEEIALIEQMVAGFDVQMAEQGINTQLRQQVLQQWMQGTEDIPALDIQQRLQNEEDPLTLRIQKHMKQLKFIDQQRENANTGRHGVPPGSVTVQ